jgi:hypothetical protein
MSGNEVDLIKLPDGTFLHEGHDVKIEGESIRTYMNAVTPEGKKWVELQLKQNKLELDTSTAMDKFKPVLMGAGIFLVMLAAIGIIMYGTYKSAAYISDKAASTASVLAEHDTNILGQMSMLVNAANPTHNNSTIPVGRPLQ